MKITFIDAGVLIAAYRGPMDMARRALAILDDPNRSFASSTFVKLEVLPKASFHKQTEEVSFYENYFRSVEHWAEPRTTLIENALSLAQERGLSALDALHGAAALAVNAAELVTSEKHSRPIHRLTQIKVTTIY
ncbi:MAG TPA: PIN domain-containing protein [Thermoanaerobaculia bacterium]|nr:PIN domain-containing protein [Thermoanaerobaculia bacterium]